MMRKISELTSRAVLRVCLLSAVIMILTALIGMHDGPLSSEKPAGAVFLPFVWRDVAVVCLISTAPMAWLLNRRIQSLLRHVPYQYGIFCLTGLSLWTLAWLYCFRFHEGEVSSRSWSVFPATVRTVTSFCITMGTTMILSGVMPRSGRRTRSDLSTTILSAVFSLAVLILVPGAYLEARGRHDTDQYVSLREQTRPAEARSLLQRILLLDPAIRRNGILLKRELAELDQSVEWLQKQTHSELSEMASRHAWLQRARHLAMLGLANKAISELLERQDTFDSVEACCLLGTLFENRHDWNRALSYYDKAETLLTSAGDNRQSSAEARQVAMGSAYCFRRLGRLQEARACYQRLLSISPDADTYFLLAQFFEDIQETSLAREHALSAMQLDPKRYTERVLSLIRKMQSLHFRCLSL